MAISPEVKKMIIRRGIRYKPGDRMVKIRPRDLVDAVGEAEARNLVPGLDVAALEAAEDDLVRGELTKLLDEESICAAIWKETRDSREYKRLKSIRKSIQAIQSGSLRGTVVVAVPVDALRDQFGDEQQPVPDLTPEQHEQLERKLAAAGN